MAAVAAEAREKEIRVAILEDEELMRDCLVDMFDRPGFRVVVSEARPDTFMASVGQLGADVALVDLMLEGTGGLDGEAGLAVLRKLRELGQDVRPIVVSANSEPEMSQECLNAGASGYLCKQCVSNRELIAAVRRVVAGERVIALSSWEHGLNENGTGHSALEKLTPREREVLACVSGGADNESIAKRLGCAERTVKAHMGQLYRKLGAENRVELALMARRLGMRASADA